MAARFCAAWFELLPLARERATKRESNPSPALPSPTAETVSNQTEPEDDSKNKDVPPEFKGIDFRNFSYQTNWRNRRIRLKNAEYQYPQGAGGDTL